jgi:alkylhydroperoxidase family enzyme
MAWIRVIEPEEATGHLARIYAAATKRAGRVFRVLSIQGIWPRVLQTSTQLYSQLMQGPGPLQRRRREMIAAAVSRANLCAY